MADLDGASRLKRKIEGPESQRKKVRTQRKGPAQNDGVATTPMKQTPVKEETFSAQKLPATTSAPKNEGKSTPQRPTPNGTPATQTLSGSKKDKKSANVDDENAIAKAEVVSTGSPKQKNKKQKKHKTSDLWSLSEPQGGWFLPQDPIFSLDEKYLLLPKLKSLEVYATETSLLARELPVGGSGSILSAALSSAESSRVYIADSTGIVTLWDWTNGSKIGRWDISANVRHMAVVKQPESELDLLFAHEAGNKHVITVHALRTKNDTEKTDSKRILKAPKAITGIQVFLQGKVVVASTANRILIGKRAKLHKTALQDFEYTWREFETSKRITTFSAYVRTPDADKGKNPLQDPRDYLDLSVGHEDGAILLFEDIIASFAAIERSQKDKSGKAIGPESLRPKRLHWHREAVGSVKWSLDGNYLISGGDETVLTLWQLSTGKQQHLPHLTAAIENIVVSPVGASYAISLANNSVIVLSTSELEAKTNIVGIQSRRVDFDQLPRDSNSSSYTYDLFSQVPMAVDPKSSQVIIATPSSQPRSQHTGFCAEPYAQTFDLANRRAVAKQAITRNNATDPNMAPNGGRIQEPSVKFMQISHDGLWLATVDEWIPPRSDMGHIEEGVPAFNEEERLFRRQVFLKIWRWDDKGEQWVLDARIDAPHFFDDVSAHAEVFDLVADPSGLGFATIGKDRVARLWRPKTRVRDGIIVRGADRTQGMVTWSLDCSVKIADRLDITEKHILHESSALRTSRLAFSADGSVLAAGVSWASESISGVIHIIDAETGAIRRSITELGVATISGLGIVGRHLIAASDTLSVWDMVSDQLVHSIPIETPGIGNAERERLVRLAVNEENGTFAIAAPRFEKGQTTDAHSATEVLAGSSKISVYEPSQSKPRWTRSLPRVVLALAATKNGRGYIALDAASSIRVISPRSTAMQLPVSPPEASRLLTDRMDIANEEEEESKSDVLKPGLYFDASDELLRISENDRPVVRPEQLQQIFESGSSHNLPPVGDLFDAVVGLYARKPRAGVSAA